MVVNKCKMDLEEDIIAKLIDFLEAPHATTAVLLAEKDKVLNFNCSFCQLSIFTHFLRYSFCLLSSLVGVESGKGLPGKMVAKGKDKAKKGKVKPSDYELRTTICGILKEVDFNTKVGLSGLCSLLNRSARKLLSYPAPPLIGKDNV
ncbi:hypothetical protein CXB51_000668 [Gossypium anomalum]|uniref:Uncharacterized protein n=1 Tax=Gossypium anomalum TaxID=47600 RepID=A0A8J5ZIR0_9ROSI|nr:hypothetical protein CXB51_000668 [Gossypium anomalum]